MAGKKPKFSVYNEANKKLDRTTDGSKTVPSAKKGMSETASKKTFSTKSVKGKKKGK